MKEISQSRIYKLSILSSIMLFLSVFYSQKLFSQLWITFVLIQITIIIFFTIILISSILFWIKKNSSYKKKYLPFCISFLCLIAVIILPLTWIRNRTNFFINENNYENAVIGIKQMNIKNTQKITLPKKYQNLSDGKVMVTNIQNQKAILFYTFRGIPDGFAGFLKIDDKQNIDSLYVGQQYYIRDLGNNWYHISVQ